MNRPNSGATQGSFLNSGRSAKTFISTLGLLALLGRRFSGFYPPLNISPLLIPGATTSRPHATPIEAPAITDLNEAERLALIMHDQVRHFLKEAALVELATIEAEERAAIPARRAKFKSGGVIIDWSTGAAKLPFYH